MRGHSNAIRGQGAAFVDSIAYAEFYMIPGPASLETDDFIGVRIDENRNGPEVPEVNCFPRFGFLNEKHFPKNIPACKGPSISQTLDISGETTLWKPNFQERLPWANAGGKFHRQSRWQMPKAYSNQLEMTTIPQPDRRLSSLAL